MSSSLPLDVLGRLKPVPALERTDLLAEPVADALRALPSVQADPNSVLVAEIDPELADTAGFCATYDVPADTSANCVVVAGKRAGVTTLAACVILATTRTDVNGFVRRHLGVRKASFASTDLAVSETEMEYGGITPVGLPSNWPLLVDSRVPTRQAVIIGSGLRRSKIIIPGEVVSRLPGAQVLEGLAAPLAEPV